MTDTNQATGLELRSLIRKTGELELSLAKVARPAPADDQVLVRVEATPINPSDLGLLLGPADMTTARSSGSGDGIVVTAKVAPASLPGLAAGLRTVVLPAAGPRLETGSTRVELVRVGHLREALTWALGR